MPEPDEKKPAPKKNDGRNEKEPKQPAPAAPAPPKVAPWLPI